MICIPLWAGLIGRVGLFGWDGVKGLGDCLLGRVCLFGWDGVEGGWSEEDHLQDLSGEM